MGRLLVVDDAMLMRRMIRDAATEAGWDVVGEAKNGREGVDLYAQLRPDLVTMDVVMPEMGGLEALRSIREFDPKARVVMVTALDQKPTIEEAIREGAIDFIVKPFDRDRIISLLSRLEVSVGRAAGLGRES
jgi:two-component system chemotaxis response regulator CheY